MSHSFLPDAARPLSRAAVATVALLAPAAAAAGATFETFNGLAAFEAAVDRVSDATIVTETFDEAMVFTASRQGRSNLYNGIDFKAKSNNGTLSRNSIAGTGVNDAPSSALNGNEEDNIIAVESLEIIFPEATFGGTYAFGGMFSYFYSATPGISLVIPGAPQRFDVVVPVTNPDPNAGIPNSGFFGIVSDTPFTNVDVVLTTNDFSSQDYQLDDLSFAPAAVASPVPEPLAGLAALAGAGLVIRRRARVS